MMHGRNSLRWAAVILGASLAAPLHAQNGEAERIAEDFDRSPEDCISTTRLDVTEVVDDRTILFYMRGNDVYRNTLADRCPGLQRAGRFSYEVRTSRLCEIDTITVLEQFGVGLSSGFTCRLGEFYPISIAEAEQIEAGPAAAVRDAVEVEEVELSDETHDAFSDDE